MHVLSNKEARHLMLAKQGLLQNFFGKGKAGTLDVIEHLGYVQIDTISVVERAHHHVLWSRTPDYQKKYLDQLIEDRQVFEYWSHAAAFLPMRDYRYSLIRKNLFSTGKRKWYNNKKMMKFVHDRITAEGPLQSKDFEEKKAKAGWWAWKDTKRALEQHFMEGKLMVCGRTGFQKIYDLTERVLPAGVDTTIPTAKEYAAYLVQKTIRANGLAAADEIGYQRSHAKKPVILLLNEMKENGELVEVKIAGGKHETYYTTPENLEQAATLKNSKQLKILSPFDNMVIQRKRLKKIFGFDYTIECYVPGPKRKYGYFCLPVLYGDEFIGRIDCKAERSDKVLAVRKMFYEPEFAKHEQVKDKLNKALKQFALFNGCDEVKYH